MVLLLQPFLGVAQDPSPENYNVLFIAVDDLRPELSCYGASHIVSPNFDRLAEQGMVFERAYCQQAVCAPSRNSLLTGLRPDSIKIYDLGTNFRTTVPEVITLPQHFKNNGYQVEAMGKIYHTSHGNYDDSISWSVPPWDRRQYRRQFPTVNKNDTSDLQGSLPAVQGRKIPWYASEFPENYHTDVGVVNRAIERMNALKDESFFIAVGFLKPHLPFIAPKKYWDLYDPAKISVPSQAEPEGAPHYSLAHFGELRKYHGIPPEGPLSGDQARKMIHGYYACVSFIDAQLGRLLDELERLELDKNTVIILWGDHGWKLGEYGQWCKHTNYELDTRSTLLVSTPGMRAKGKRTTALVEFVDIYPTLCGLAGLPTPAHLQGTSFQPLLDDPEISWKRAAVSQYPRKQEGLMGYSLRTDRYRLVSWRDQATRINIRKNELYDHKVDPGETRNLANTPEHATLVKALNEILDREYIQIHNFN